MTDVQLIVEQQKTIMSLSEHRANLAPDEACPLCGSEQHPAVADYQALSSAGAVETEHQRRLKQLTSELEQLELQGKGLSSEQERLTERLNFITENNHPIDFLQKTTKDELKKYFSDLPYNFTKKKLIDDYNKFISTIPN